MAAKDGTNRGGARPGAGRKRKPLAEKIAEGKTAKIIPAPPDLETADMPAVKEYLSDDQRMGNFYAKEIYEETWQWIKQHGCDHIISPQLIEQYAVAMARYVQLERITSEYGFISKHPTTGAPIASPFVNMSVNYLRAANLLWQQIFSIVRENCAEYVDGHPMDDDMERLLRGQ